jgi:hypothetical protein
LVEVLQREGDLADVPGGERRESDGGEKGESRDRDEREKRGAVGAVGGAGGKGKRYDRERWSETRRKATVTLLGWFVDYFSSKA